MLLNLNWLLTHQHQWFFVVEFKHHIEHLNESWNPNVVSSSCPKLKIRITSWNRKWNNKNELRFSVIQGFSKINWILFLKKSYCNQNNELISSVLFLNFFFQDTQHSRQTVLQCLSRFNDTAASSPFQFWSSVDLKLDFGVELAVDDIAEFGEWLEGMAVDGW